MLAARSLVASTTFALALGGCTTAIGSHLADDDDGADLGECAGGVPGAAPIRRLNREEYSNTVADLLGDTTRPADGFPAEEEVDHFDNNAEVMSVSAILAEKYLGAAEAIAARATDSVAKVAALVGCDPADDPAGCARSFIETFGRRAARRPLTSEEVDGYAGLWSWQDGDFTTGVRLVIVALLQSPEFLYRVEEGGEPRTGEVQKLDHWQVASRLSYFLWGTMPDDELFRAAEDGELGDKAAIAAQARRLLASPRARRTVSRFHEQWLRLREIGGLEKDASIYPEMTLAVKNQLALEARKFIEHVVFDGEGDLATLLTAPYTFANDALAGYYGLPAPGSKTFQKVSTEGTGRRGLLSQGGLLAVLAQPGESSPILRGTFVRETLLCTPLPDPPDDLMIVLPEPDPDATTRERFSTHSSDPACSGCHSMIDPIGFGFEKFDGIGRWRTEENGLPIDATGALTSTDVDGPFDGVAELADRLAASEQVASCATRQWFRFGFGRTEREADACTIAYLDEAMGASGGDIQELLVALTQTDAFLYRTGEMP